MLPPSRHFSWRELGSPPARRRDATRHLASHLERLREIVGRPLPVVSGYRTAARNKRVGGSSASQHLYGRAADIPPGYATTAQAVQAGFSGIGSAGRWALHVDVRPGPQAHWHY